MAQPGKFIAINNEIVPTEAATVSVASSAVMYGLSVYSVIYAKKVDNGFLAFRLKDHLIRLRQSAHMIGLDNVDHFTDETATAALISKLLEANNPTGDQFIRITIHATDLVPGIRTRNLGLSLSIFLYDAVNILPQSGARIKTSLWRRTADTAIPARAKVNGAYVNSALAKQDAIDSGFDDCLFLNHNGYVSELSAANIFMVKNSCLHTPDTASDILEGITRRSVIELAKELGISVCERNVALTELYTADEVFACGTSAFVSPLLEIDSRKIGAGTIGTVTERLRNELVRIQGEADHQWISRV
ncbi:MAG TPA: aminotransferase class IV [Candidatus Paceibacterota bacterium]